MPTGTISLFDEAELNGYWWLPSRPDHQSCGSVSLLPESGIVLKLLGTLGGPADLSSLGSGGVRVEPIIRGFTADGKEVTLFDSYTSFSQFRMPGFSEEHYRSSVAFLGEEAFDLKEDIKFSAVDVNFTHMEEWVTLSPFAVSFDSLTSSGRGASASYQPPPSIEAFVQCLTTRILIRGRFDMKFDRRRELRWSYDHYVEISPDQPQPWDWFLNVIIGMAELLTLLMWQPIYPRRVVGLGKERTEQRRDGSSVVKQSSTEIYWHFLEPQIEPAFVESNVLLRLSALDSRLGSILEAWFSCRERLEPICELFSGSLYVARLPTSFKFLAMTQALEGLHRATIGGQYHPDHEYECYKAELKQRITELSADNDWKNKFIDGELRWGNQYSQRKRLKELLGRVEAPLRDLLVRNVGQFVDHIVDTRNYLTHMDQNSRNTALQGTDRFLAFHKLQILLGILLLREAGFSDSELANLLATNASVTMSNLLKQSQHI